MRFTIALFMLGSLGVYAAEEKRPCVFCEIVAGRIDASRVVYRDDTVVAFMSLGQRNPGHVLVVPNEHADGVLDVPSATLGHMAEVAQTIVRAIRKTDLKAEGFNLQSNTGAVAGQTVFHLHLHVIPRFKGEAPSVAGERKSAPAAELDAAAQKIRIALGQ